MQTLIFLPTQGPHLDRPGSVEQFDWRVQCRLAADLQRTTPESIIYVPSAFRQAGTKSEIEFYRGQLLEEGVPEASLRLEPRGLETVEQCELALAVANREQSSLAVVVCEVQARRVRHLMKGHEVKFIIARGTPNQWLQFTNLILGVLFPVVDALGLRGWWKQRIAGRRLQGKQ